MRTFTVGLTLGLLLGCDAYKKDVETVCNARARVKLPPKAEAGEETEAIKAFLFTNIHSPKAKKIFLSMGNLSDAEKLALLRKEAGATGVAPCPLADEVEAALKAPPPPPAPLAAPAMPDVGG
ncbi:MAG: hypothetical protein JNJ54_00785 [Myxococcaceae bacterium]|nr:hypothetical protein [Myxococcaceae bacterium]